MNFDRSGFKKIGQAELILVKIPLRQIIWFGFNC